MGDWLLQMLTPNFHTSLSVNQNLRNKFLIYNKFLILQMDEETEGCLKTYPLVRDKNQVSSFHFSILSITLTSIYVTYYLSKWHLP